MEMRAASPGRTHYVGAVEARTGKTTVHYVEHGSGRPAVILHGAGVDHRESEACFELAFAGATGIRRIYPDLPGMGRTPAPVEIRSAEDVLTVLLEFVEQVSGDEPSWLIGHSAGAHFALAMAERHPTRVAGLALVCPLLPGIRDVPEHRVVVGSGGLGDEEFRGYFVVQTPEMLERYERFVVPGMELADETAMERIGERWELAPGEGTPFDGPTLVVAGRLDSTVGYAAALDLADRYPHATAAVLDDTGHALPHERPELLRALIQDWLDRVSR
ncbi:2-hydroxymuconate semialdehyde hydrolase [Microbacterium azadirachtae]|uniref:2-hydroxymuconate semialdehyde hydrolase n=1 Tax=Microbacterium azadirachtae TaxID=582680 RepID=A0A0F0LKY0_9MICO|nr:2-hydroxymuconate semialdehyde hydrolase [Microbacterium azadirachtae]